MPKSQPTLLQMDTELIRKGKLVAKFLGCGYRVIGAGPGLLIVSDQHPGYSLNLPDALVEKLYALASFGGK